MSDSEPVPDPVPNVEEETEEEAPEPQGAPEEPAAEEVSGSGEVPAEEAEPERADEPEEAAEADEEDEEEEAEEAHEEEEVNEEEAHEDEEEADEPKADDAEGGDAEMDGGDEGDAEADEHEAPEEAAEEAEGPLHPTATLSRDGIVRSDFDSLVELIDNPAWETVKQKSGIELKRLRGEDGLQHVRGEFKLAMTPMEFSEVVSGHDFEARKAWDKRCIRWEAKEQFDDHHDIVHYAVSSGFPFVWNRSMLLERIRLYLDSGEMLAFATSVDRPDLCPIEADAQEKLERAHVHVSGYRVVPEGEGGCHVTFVLKIDLKGRLSIGKSNSSAERTVLSHANIPGIQ